MNNDDIEKAINASGLKKKWIAKELGITYNSLRRKLNDEISWSKLEIDKLIEILSKYL